MSNYNITNSNDLTTLDNHFKDNLYVGGHSPNNQDLLLFEQFTSSNTEPNQQTHQNLWSWFALVSLYTPQIKETWKAAQGKPAQAQKPAQKKAEPKQAAAPKKEEPKPAADDDVDLFGDDDEDAEALEALKKKKELEKKGKKKDLPIAKSIILLDIKVWDPEQDYDALAAKILKIEKDGLLWKTEYKLVDVAFGVKKIVMGLVVEDEKVSVEDLIEELEGWEDDIQSVDIQSFNKI